MDKNQIAILAHKMETKEDLLNLLNHIKHEDVVDMGFADKYHPFTMSHINYFCNPNNAFHRYRQFKIKKKTGGFRQITAPRKRSFMLILTYVNEILKSIYTPSDYAMGFTEGRSVVTNAEIHKGQLYVFNTDLKDFFPSIAQARVWKRLQIEPFNFPQPVANVLAGLCSMKETRKLEDGTMKDFYILPQGAPTSPIITNMICDKLDRRLAGLARRFGLHFTRYADDITFSSMHNVYKENSDFRKELNRIICEQGFTLNEKKTRLQKLGGRQEVTGIIVSNKLNVSQKYVRDIRNILYIWDKYGYNSAYAKFFPKYKEEKGHVKKGNPDLINVLDGKLMYLKMVKGEDDSVYTRLYNKFIELVEHTKDPKKTNQYGITYVETTPVLEFEQNNSTQLVFETKTITNVSTEGSDNPDVPIETITKIVRTAHILLNGKKTYVTINKSIKPEEEYDKSKMAISSCRDRNNKPFWLVHSIDKITVPPSPTINIDELNADLDTLLSI